MTEQPTRRTVLAAAIQRETGPWTTTHAMAINAAAGYSGHRNTARKDIRALVRAGVLAPATGTGNCTYVLPGGDA
ncbi:hypothetical protein ABZ883_14605 [Streptomyces sp. NPDC046977]|uniref:hypothetical protein n=1 Tax=Streptomyces sp. NPDC046977 TaxID=3154703 RepID=UPI0033C529D1